MTLTVRHRAKAQTSAREIALGRLISRRLRFETDRPIYFGSFDGFGSPPRCTPDLLFRRGMVAVFVDGCYWHECPEHYPNARGGAIWLRDQRNNTLLADAGWLVLRIWEHDPSLKSFACLVVDEVRRRRKAL